MGLFRTCRPVLKLIISCLDWWLYIYLFIVVLGGMILIFLKLIILKQSYCLEGWSNCITTRICVICSQYPPKAKGKEQTYWLAEKRERQEEEQTYGIDLLVWNNIEYASLAFKFYNLKGFKTPFSAVSMTF